MATCRSVQHDNNIYYTVITAAIILTQLKTKGGRGYRSLNGVGSTLDYIVSNGRMNGE
jgi:hypothetical protein